jgi:hypothetical protein
MSFESKITILARRILFTRISPKDPAWPEISLLCEAYGENEVVDAFEKWVPTRADKSDNRQLLGDFIGVADELIKQSATGQPTDS